MAFISLNSSALTAVGNARVANKGINNLRIQKKGFTPPGQIDFQLL